MAWQRLIPKEGSSLSDHGCHNGFDFVSNGSSLSSPHKVKGFLRQRVEANSDINNVAGQRHDQVLGSLTSEFTALFSVQKLTVGDFVQAYAARAKRVETPGCGDFGSRFRQRKPPLVCMNGGNVTVRRLALSTHVGWISPSTQACSQVRDHDTEILLLSSYVLCDCQTEVEWE